MTEMLEAPCVKLEETQEHPSWMNANIFIVWILSQSLHEHVTTLADLKIT